MPSTNGASVSPVRSGEKPSPSWQKSDGTRFSRIIETKKQTATTRPLVNARLRKVADAFSNLDPVEFPNTTALLPRLMSGTGDERFAFGLRLMINGLLATDPPEAD
jgi:Tetracyclin repressor-like, C-terminal domain